jgi:hypothetical protein
MNGSLEASSPTWEFFVTHANGEVDTSWLGPPDFDRNGHFDAAIGASNEAFVMLNTPPAGLPASSPSQSLMGGEEFGAAMANAGDVNGDGYGDLLVGAWQAGTASIFLGSPSGLGLVPEILGTGEMNYGEHVAGAGDVNGDGYADVVVGNDSVAFLYLGGPDGVALTASGPTLNGGDAAGAGDVNGDGFADVMACDPHAGTAAVYLGSPAGLGRAAVIYPPAPENGFANECLAVGDVNGDGFSDIAIASNDNTGLVFVYYGSANGIVATPTVLSPMPIEIQSWRFVASAGDVNGDGFGDVVVGSLDNDAVYLYLGSSAGISTDAATTYSGFPAGQFGANVGGIGDADGDGYDDIIVTPAQCSGFDVYVYSGSATGLATMAPLRDWPTPPGSQCFDTLAL